MNKKYTTEFFIEKARLKHGDTYDYSKSICNSCDDKVKIICKTHGEFLQAARLHFKFGCSKCNFVKMHKASAKSRTITFEKFQQLASEKFQNKFTYFESEYINFKTETKILCPNHGYFFKTPVEHINKRANNSGCKKCTDELRSVNMALGIDEFIHRANQSHNNKYDYSLVKYINHYTEIEIICPVHGKFYQTPHVHVRANGCCECTIETEKSIWKKEFIAKSKTVHNDKYRYEYVEYNNAHAKVCISCPLHGQFFQQPTHHIEGKGCQKCAKIISKPEIKWLDSLNIPNKNRNIRIKLHTDKYTNVDGFDPSTKKVYEFHGDFWHGNPNIYNSNDVNSCTKTTFGELYRKTVEKENTIRQSGYTLIVMWESDFISS